MHREVRSNTFRRCWSDTSGQLSLFASVLSNHNLPFHRCPAVTRGGRKSLDVVQAGGTIAGLTDSFGVVHLFPLTMHVPYAYIPPLSVQVWFPRRNYRAAECSVPRSTRRPLSPISRREPHLFRKWRLTRIILIHSTNHQEGQTREDSVSCSVADGEYGVCAVGVFR
jgi:hypothetical protein